MEDSVAMGAGGVFINYRGAADSRYAADLLYAGLSQALGLDLVFLDSESIKPGADFVTTLLDRVRRAQVVLAVIGPRWLTATTGDGRRYIDDPDDWIRRELVEAFEAEVLVIPILTDDATMPTEVDLPADIARLGRAQYMLLRQRHAQTDIALLQDRLVDLFPVLVPYNSGATRQSPSRPMPPVPRQLPPTLRDFTGRAEALAALDLLLRPAGDSSRGSVIVVLDGIAGVGKTTLAVRWAHRVQHRFPDGTLFVNLRGYGPSAPLTPHVVLSWFLVALGVAETNIPAELDAQVGMYRSVLAQRQVLLLLDNAINLEQVRPLLPGVAGCLVLVTSRAGMTELVVAEAATRVGVGLFTAAESHALLRRILGSGPVGTESSAVTELVRVCTGLPLAVRVAATRVAARPQLDIADVVAEISEDHGRGHDDAFRSASDMGEAVRSVFDWSYVQLSIGQARVFRRLGLHPSPEFGVHAVAAFAGMSSVAIYRRLEALAELHLVEPVGPKQYRMHDLLHAYAGHRAELEESPQARREAMRRGLAWYARTAQHADRTAYPALPGLPREVDPTGEDIAFADEVRAVAWLRAEYANLVAAVRRAVEYELVELAMALAASARFMSYREHALSALHIDITSLGLAAARVGRDQTVEAVLLSMRGDTLEYLGRLDEAETDFARVLTLADDLDDPFHLIGGLCGLGRVRLRADRLDEAREYYRQALTPSEGMSEGRAAAVVHANLSQICTRLGEFEQALDHADRELTLRRQADSKGGEAYAMHDAALAWQGLMDHEAAIRLCREAIACYRALGEIGDDLVRAILTLATSLEHVGNRVGAAVSLREALAVLTQLDDPRAQAICHRLEALESRPVHHPPC